MATARHASPCDAVIINYIFHEYLEEDIPPSIEGGNVVIVPRHGLADERQLVFGPIVFRGTIACLHYLKFNLKQAGWPDLVWPFGQDEKIFNFSNLPKHDLLNDDFIKTTSNEGRFNIRFPAWIKSNSGNKLFSGGVFTREQYLEELKYFDSLTLQPFDIVYASPKKIGKEWRIFIIDNICIGASQYMDGGEIDARGPVPENVIAYAEMWNKLFGSLYEGNYVLDVCESEGFYKIVETNSLLTSGAYSIDSLKIVNAMAESIRKKFLTTEKK